MIKVEYYVGLKLVESHYKPNKIIAKWFINQLKLSGNYKGKFKLKTC
jgi:hypothetical protein